MTLFNPKQITIIVKQQHHCASTYASVSSNTSFTYLKQVFDPEDQY